MVKRSRCGRRHAGKTILAARSWKHLRTKKDDLHLSSTQRKPRWQGSTLQLDGGSLSCSSSASVSQLRLQLASRANSSSMQRRMLEFWAPMAPRGTGRQARRQRELQMAVVGVLWPSGGGGGVHRGGTQEYVCTFRYHSWEQHLRRDHILDRFDTELNLPMAR